MHTLFFFFLLPIPYIIEHKSVGNQDVLDFNISWKFQKIELHETHVKTLPLSS